MSYSFADSFWAGSGCNILILLASCLFIPLLCVRWKTADDGQRNCPKHVEFHSKNKFEKLVHLVGFILRNLSQCTVTWTSVPLLLLFMWLASSMFSQQWFIHQHFVWLGSCCRIVYMDACCCKTELREISQRPVTAL
jgi:hypothetical protein